MFNQKLKPINNDPVALNQEVKDLKATFQKITNLSGELIKNYQSFTLKSKQDLTDDIDSMMFRTSILLNKRIEQLQDGGDQPSVLSVYLELKKKLLRNQELFKVRLDKIIENQKQEKEKNQDEPEVKISYKSFLGKEEEKKNEEEFFDFDKLDFNFQSNLIQKKYQKIKDLRKEISDFFYQESAISQIKPKLKEIFKEIDEISDEGIDQNQLMLEKLKLKQVALFVFKISNKEFNLPKNGETNFSKITQIIYETLSLIIFVKNSQKNSETNSQLYNLSIKKIIDFWQNYQDIVQKLSSEFIAVINHSTKKDLDGIINQYGLSFKDDKFGFYLVYSSKNETFSLRNFDKNIIKQLNQAYNLNELVDVIDNEIKYVPYFKKTLNFYQKSQFKQKVLASILRTQNPTSTRKIINNLPILDADLKKVLAEKITVFKQEQVEKQQKRMLAEKTKQLVERITNFLQTQQTLSINFINFKTKMVDKGVFRDDDQKEAKEIYRQLKKDYQKQEIDYINLLLTLNNLNLENPELIKKSSELITIEKSLNDFKVELQSFEKFFV